MQVTGFLTQGRCDGEEWVTAFMVSHSVDGFHWQYVADIYANQKVVVVAVVVVVVVVVGYTLAASYLVDDCVPVTTVAGRRHLRSADSKCLVVPMH